MTIRWPVSTLRTADHTVVSVGPYMFQSEPQRGKSSFASCAVQASPPQRTFKRGDAGPASVDQHAQGAGGCL